MTANGDVPMDKRTFITGGLIALIFLMLSYQITLAHESVTVGNYELEIGWVDEPAIAGQKNAILVNVVDISTGEPVEDVSSLTVAIFYGIQEKELTLQPLGEDTPGQFMAPLLPTLPGQYTIHLGGQLGDTPVDTHAEPEEVEAADTLQFPIVESSEQSAGSGTRDWLIYVSILIGLIALVLALGAIRNSR